jgi:TRAP-type uncharacterized transport system fused permease subunit
LKVPAGGNWVDVVEIFIETGVGIAFLAFATQGWFQKKNTLLETALFTIAGLFLVFPALLGSVVDPLLGVDLEAFVPRLSAIGWRVGYNVFLGLIVFALTWSIQRARRA